MPNLSNFKTKEERNEYYREYRKRNREKLRKYNREYNKNWRAENGYHNEEKSKLRYPEKQKARGKISNEIIMGRLERKPCAICGQENAQAHHPDYSKPLEVEWLCPLHHTEAHKKLSTSIT